MSNRVIPQGSINPNATIAPGVVVIESITPGTIAGIPANVVGAVGTATYGPVDAPLTVSDIGDYINNFGFPQTSQYDMGTFVNVAGFQGTTASYTCVRVTDDTDVHASTRLLDTLSVPATGVILSAFFSGSTGNTFQATLTAGTAPSSFQLTIGRPGYAAEIFNNITGSGATFWTNLKNAVNNGQSGARGPSQLAIASLGDTLGGITVTNAGTGYTTIPGVTFMGGGGTGAAASAVMLGLTATPATPQSGSGSYAPNDTVTFTGGTGVEPVMTVNTTQVVSAAVASGGSGGTPGTQTVTGTTGTGTKFQASVTVSGGGAITAVLSITVAGSYTVNPTVLTAEPVTGASLSGATLNIKMGVLTGTITTPGSLSVLASNPVAQGTTSGTGTGFTANLTYGVSSVTITNVGSGYTTAPTVGFSGGGGSNAAATAVVGSITAPSITNNPYQFANGTDGNTGVTGTTELGTDGAQPEGMYALRPTNVSIFALVDDDDPTTYTAQDAFAKQTTAQAVLIGPPSQSVSQGVTAKNSAGLSSTTDNSCVFLLGDWTYYKDTFNGGITRLISPQGFYCGELGNLSPEESPLNKQISGILATQTSSSNQIYSDQDVVTMMQNGIDVLAIPSPGGSYFSAQTGKSIGIDQTTNNVFIQRMANFLAVSLSRSGVLGAFIGNLQTSTVRRRAQAALTSFLQNLKINEQIEDFSVILNDSNNPNNRVVLGFMQASVSVQLFSVIIVFLIDLNVGTASIQSVSSV